MADDPVLVIGGGLTGLGAAWALARQGVGSRIIDPAPAPGGMAAGFVRDGWPLRPGVHLLHASEDRLRPLVDEVTALMGDRAVRVHPVSHVHFLGRFLQYPLRKGEVIRALGPRRAALIAASAVRWRLQARTRDALGRQAPDTFETVVRDAVGDVLYRLFFRDYTRKVTGIDPAALDGEWARRRVPLPQGRHLVRNLMPWYRPETIDHPHSPFHRLQVTGPDGIDGLFRALMEACGDRARYEGGSRLARLEVQGRRACRALLVHRDGSSEEVRDPRVIATLPLQDLCTMLDAPPPAPVRESASRLRHRGLVLVHLALDRPPLLPSHWTYFQDGDLPFNRVSEYGALLPGLYGPDRTVVCAEVTADSGEAAWQAAEEAGDATVDPDGPGTAARLVREVISGLERVRGGPLRPLLRGAWVTGLRRAYPGWHRGFREDRRLVLDYLDALEGLVVAGRQGRFDYLNMDQCLDSGIGAARRLLEPSRTAPP